MMWHPRGHSYIADMKHFIKVRQIEFNLAEMQIIHLVCLSHFYLLPHCSLAQTFFYTICMYTKTTFIVGGLAAFLCQIALPQTFNYASIGIKLLFSNLITIPVSK